jgi:endo-1,4-beta-xylanase
MNRDNNNTPGSKELIDTMPHASQIKSSSGYLSLVLVLFLVLSCGKKDSTAPISPTTTAPADTTTIKGATNITTGVAISYDLMKNNTTYASLVKTQFDRVTFEYQMKHAPNVQNDGSFNFTNTDELVNLVQSAAMKIHGHTLVWHQNNNGTYLRSLVVPGGSGYDSARVSNAMHDWITAAVSRYKGKVTGWDVVNEAFAEDGSLRTGVSANDAFYWYPVLGPSYIANAFTWAHQSDPNALLFINDYNLESNPAKLDALISKVSELRSQGVPINGIGTQMHISINTPDSDIDNMFIKLAATGLMVHVSELDIRVNPDNSSSFAFTQTLQDSQAKKYKYVAASYKKNIPAAQQYGITVWDVSDADSWIVTSQKNNDYPTLFDKSYNKKAAFTQFVAGLKE